jgi:quercetin dioxygenase-like cupin family protein
MAGTKPTCPRWMQGALVAALAAACLPALAEETLPTESDTERASGAPITNFEGSLRIKAVDGKEGALKLVLRQWFLPKSGAASIASESSVLLIHRLAGRMTVNVEGKPEVPESGAYWIVPPGAHISVAAGPRGARFEVTAVRGP